MFLKGLRLVTILLTALGMALAVGHLPEMSLRLGLDAPAYFASRFGPHRTEGADVAVVYVEAGAIAALLLLTLAVRRRYPAFGWTLLTVATMGAAHALLWTVVVPLDQAFAAWSTPASPPDGWLELRRQWEYAGAARALLQAVALTTLTMSVLVEVPRRVRSRRRRIYSAAPPARRHIRWKAVP